MVRAAKEVEATVRDLDPEEWRAFVDAQAHEWLGMSRDEFIRRWNAGEFAAIVDDPDHRGILYLAMLTDGER